MWTRRMHGVQVIGFHCTLVYTLFDFALRSKAGALCTNLYANRWTDAAVLLPSDHCAASFPAVWRVMWNFDSAGLSDGLFCCRGGYWWSGPFLCGWKLLYTHFILWCSLLSALPFSAWILSIFTITVAVLWRACLFESGAPDIITATALLVCAYHIDFLCNRQHCMAWHAA
jgi:hypothetical protein